MELYLAFLLCVFSFIIGRKFTKILQFFIKKSQGINNNKTSKQKSNKKKDDDNDNNDEWESDFDDADLKMVFVVRQDLKMGAGKIAAQVAHAAVGLFDKITSKGDKFHKDALDYWNTFGCKKIVLKGDNLDVLVDCSNKCKRANIPYILISDAGHTQVPAGSVTVLGIGVDTSENIDKITGTLKLMR